MHFFRGYKLYLASLGLTFLKAEIDLPKEKEAQRGEGTFPSGRDLAAAGLCLTESARESSFCVSSAVVGSGWVPRVTRCWGTGYSHDANVITA